METRGAGQGGLGLAIEGPSEAKMNCRDNRDGSCTVEYLPTKPGDYDITIKFADRPIPGEFVTVQIKSFVYSHERKQAGHESSGFFTGTETKFHLTSILPLF